MFSWVFCTDINAQSVDSVSKQDTSVAANNESYNSALYETVKVRKMVSNVSRGYRIQIYSGPNRDNAKKIKVDFMKRFPSIRSYINYEVPHYKIKVGDFKTKKEAGEFYRYLNKTYSATIVSCLINDKVPYPEPKPEPVHHSSNADSDSKTTSTP